MKKHIPFLIALLMIAMACQKDPDPNNNGQDPSTTDGIVFGQTDGMIVTIYDTIMEYDDNSKPFVLDLNGDGTDDIKIETVYDGPLTIGNYQTLSLYCLNGSIEVLGDSIVKETYSHRDTTITTNNGWTTTLYGYTFSTCDKVDETDYVGNTKVFELKASDVNDLLSPDDHFQFAEVKLFEENKEYSWYDPDEATQTVIGNQNKYIYDCWNFPTDEEKYIGFKLITDGETRLGWLKIKLCPTWGGRVVDTQLIETAIQIRAI